MRDGLTEDNRDVSLRVMEEKKERCKKEQSEEPNLLITEGLALIILTGLYYHFVYCFEAGYCDYFGLPTSQIRPDVVTLLSFASMVFEGACLRVVMFALVSGLLCSFLVWWVHTLRKKAHRGACLQVGAFVILFLLSVWCLSRVVHEFGRSKARGSIDFLYRHDPREEVVLRVYDGVAITAGIYSQTNLDCEFRVINLQADTKGFTLRRMGPLNPEMVEAMKRGTAVKP